MKVIHIIIGLGIGGAELMLSRLVEGLNGEKGMQHSIISLTDLGSVGKLLQDAGVNVTALGMKNALSLPAIFLKLRRELKKQEPDIVQTWMYHADFLGGLAAKSLGIDNVIWGVRTTDVTLGRSKMTVVLRKICALLSYYVPKFIVFAADAGRKTHQQVGYDSSRMRVIPNGFDLNNFKVTLEQRRALRDECGFGDEHIVIGSVGRFNVIKNQQAFVEVAALVSSAHHNARFFMVGRDNTPDNTELMDWIIQKGLQDKFFLLGQRSDVPVCLAAMDIFCLHSKTEGFPNALAEALILGVPCVSYNVGDVENILDKRFIAEGNEPVYLSESINDLLASCGHNKDVFGLISEKMKEEYSLDKVFDSYYRVYLECGTL